MKVFARIEKEDDGNRLFKTTVTDANLNSEDEATNKILMDKVDLFLKDFIYTLDKYGFEGSALTVDINKFTYTETKTIDL